MTSCAAVRALFSDYRDGALSEIEAETVRGHLAVCAGCARVWQRYEGTLSALRQLAPTMPAGMEAGSRQQVLGGRSWRRPPLPRPALGALAAAAVVAVALAGVLAQQRPAAERRAGQTAPAALACAEQMRGLWHVSATGLRSPVPAHIPKARLLLDREELSIPALLVAHGPYEVAVGEARESDGVVCIPLRAAYGDVLVLSIAAGPAVPHVGTAFWTDTDPARVLYTWVSWTSDGRLWRLEGRAPAGDLLTLAEEIGSRARTSGG